MVPAIENNKSKKLLNKYSRNEEPMEVEPVLEKLEEKAVAPGQTNPPARQLNELLIQQSDGVSSFYCLKEEGAKIGRHSSNKILILEESVSRYHAEIEYEDGQFFIRDIGSTTGTFIKIIDKIELEEVTVGLTQGMIIEMGSNQFEVGRIKEGEVILRIIEGPNADTAEIPLVLKKGVKVNCGRKPTNQINFQDDQHLSNIHASFYNIENHYYLEDLATTNGYRRSYSAPGCAFPRRAPKANAIPCETRQSSRLGPPILTRAPATAPQSSRRRTPRTYV